MSDNIKQPQSDHLQRNPLPPSTSRLWEHNSEILPTASSSQFDDGQYVSIVIGEGAAQDTPQDSHTTDMASYGMAEYSPPQTYATAPYIMYPPAGAEFVEGIPQHQQVIFRVNQGNDLLASGHALRREIPRPAHAAVTYPSTHHSPPLGLPTAENLRQLANHYVHHPGSQVDAVCIDGTSAGRYKVTIALEVTDFL